MTHWCALHQTALSNMQWQTVAEAKAEDKVEHSGMYCPAIYFLLA